MLGMCETLVNDTLTACKCEIGSKCTIGVYCECVDYCPNNKPLYDKIRAEGITKICWLTFSPKPQTEAMRQFGASDYDRFKDFHKSYFKKNKYVKDYILVSELSKKGLLHFHVFFSFTSKVSIYKTIVQPLYFQGNVEAIFHNTPRQGIHYLFKDTQSMIEYYDGETPYFMSVYALLTGTDNKETIDV